MNNNKTGFTFVEIIVAVTVFSLIVLAVYSLLSSYTGQSVKGTSMLDSSAVLSEVYNLLQQDMLKSKSFEIRDSSNNVIPSISDKTLDGNTPLPETENCRLVITLSDGKKVKYYKEQNALVRESSSKKLLGPKRIKKANFVALFSENQTGQKYYGLLFSNIELQPETQKSNQQHKLLKMRFFLAPSIF
jgi:prepilin-type N-terminal cleavage/methylation domain-containing protein